MKNSMCIKQKTMEDNFIDYISGCCRVGVIRDYIAAALKDEEIKHDTIVRPDELNLLERYGIKLAPI